MFNWKDILENWNTSYAMPYPVQTVIENLDRVREANLSCIQFKKYLNFMEEDEGLKWLLFEYVMKKPNWNSLQFCYFLRGITDDVSLDTGFPKFPGSPQGITARAFIESHLSALEIDFLDMMPPLIPITQTQYVPAPPAPTRAPPPAQARKLLASMQIRIIRTVDGEDNQDDIITLMRQGDNQYKFSYYDPTAKGSAVRMTVDKIPLEEVITRLSQTLRLMTLDSVPFEAIQLLLPGYPCIVLPLEKLNSSTRDLIYDTLETAMNKWPVLHASTV